MKDKEINIWGSFKKLLHTRWFPSTAFIVMIIMKLVGLLTWPWWIVMSPLLAIPVMAGIVLVGAVLVGVTYPVWNPIYTNINHTYVQYLVDKEKGKNMAKRQSMTIIQTALFFIKRTLRFIFVS